MYKCIKGFSVDMCDDDGFAVENEYMDVKKGSIWSVPDDDSYRFIYGEVRLENGDFGWIEIQKETLNENFEVIR